MSAETGDYDSHIPLPQVWLDQRHGLTAGEHLRAHLLRMEHEYLLRTERRLELVKTISLRRLFNDALDPQGVGSWDAALLQLQTTGALEFKLTQLQFDRDYPGHFCRQISSVEVDLPVLTGPFEDVRAILLQVGSMTASRASVQSVQYLHDPDLAQIAPSDLLFNLRPGQQIALSVGIADNGMPTVKPDEGLLNPFENTGVVSAWELKWPWHEEPPQAAMLRSMNDCIVRIRYTCKSGDQSFTDSVKELVKVAEESRLASQGKGARGHE